MTYSISDSYNTRFNIPKPDFPFTVGKQLQVRPHIPPPPPRNRFSAFLENDRRHERDFIDPVQRCLLHPPVLGPRGGLDSGVTELEIVRLVRAGDGHAAQLLAVRVLTSTNGLLPDMNLLAKLYDPLYFDHEQDDVDPFLAVYRAHTRECAVYKKVADLQGSVIPKFYGSFTLSLPVSQTYTREVRLILMEIVPGLSMDHLSPSNFKKSERQAIMKSIIDSETALYNRDINDRDIHPRNILVVSEESNRDEKVVVVDFGSAWTSRSKYPDREQGSLPRVPISPLLRWIVPPEELKPWIDWDWKVWVERQYEHTKDSITEYMQRRWAGGIFEGPEA
ncbi:uncharacterized protein BP5553_07674 [Venustampulla echinocandica]|uniref:Protein kinase domain-containing protein n=1 Tax=Venustampulla echinocandica TaxID=2656787 RepID=A0A370TH70_9HELO|nr:uncharacterized protein BP5553_07674 [Venustampulla echinocandica]RDL34546.1 hypothetical protein BP5553_07674 [Venustampulla echinocandica]